jgi:hypothetical protein
VLALEAAPVGHVAGDVLVVVEDGDFHLSSLCQAIR